MKMDLSKCGGVCKGACKHYAIGVECPPDATYEPRALNKTIVQKAKEWLAEPKPDNGAPEPDEFEEVREIISGLLLEVKCLKIQVSDRGNSFQKATDKNKQLRATLKEVSGCHEKHDTPKLCAGCLISICDALAE